MTHIFQQYSKLSSIEWNNSPEFLCWYIPIERGCRTKQQISSWGCLCYNVYYKYTQNFLGKCHFDIGLSHKQNAKSHPYIQISPSKISKFFPNSHLNSNLPLNVFGCTAFVHIYSHHRNKLDPCVLKICIDWILTYTKGL